MPIMAMIGRMALGSAWTAITIAGLQPLGLGGAHVVLAEHVDHARAHHPRIPAGAEDAEGERRQDEVGEACRSRRSGTSRDERRRRRGGGCRRRIAAPTRRRRRRPSAPGRASRPRQIAARTPMVRPITSSQKIAPTMRRSVAGRRDQISVATSRLLQVGAAEVALRRAPRDSGRYCSWKRPVEAELRGGCSRPSPALPRAAGDLLRRVGGNDEEEDEGDEASRRSG